ncbi:MAG: hypothetical protein CBC09_07655 [Cellvibrionales bacterium TMED49]|nr:hypothetical protein [Porticoccaceae bacterium]OUU37013.1 MAG: hypothetical protein CBC09_07655 [Cellvibrionales bacterium TMED49]
MYSTENYFWGWIAYSFGVFSLLLCFWYMVRGLKSSALRQGMVLVAIVFFMTPVTAYYDDFHLAPAFFVSLYEGLLLDSGFQRGLAPILAMIIITLTLYGSSKFLWKKMKRPPPVRVRPAFSSDKRRRSHT